MITLIVRRVVAALPLLLLISIISYALMGLSPGGPTAIFTQQAHQISPAARAQFIHALGLDRPWYVQYAYWLWNLVGHGSLGISFVDQRPVIEKILEKMPVTIEMVGLSLVCTILIALPIGIYSAIRRGSAFDYAATVLAFASYGMPVFWLAVIVIDLFAVHLHWFPTSGVDAVGHERDQLDRLYHLVLPAAVLTVVSLAGWIRYQRAAMLNVLGRTLFAYRAQQRALRASRHLQTCAPQCAVADDYLARLEPAGALQRRLLHRVRLFDPRDGVSWHHAIFQRDYPTVMALTMLTAVFVVLGNLLADICYGLADPRIVYD